MASAGLLVFEYQVPPAVLERTHVPPRKKSLIVVGKTGQGAVEPDPVAVVR